MEKMEDLYYPFDYQVSSLYDLTIEELCRNMNEERFKAVLENATPSICLEIIWKVLDISNKTQKFMVIEEGEDNPTSVIRGKLLANMSRDLDDYDPFTYTSDSAYDKFANTQQTKFVDNFNFCDQFNLNLFFKLVAVPGGRNKLFTIFQVCIPIRGFQFPKYLAEEWIKREGEFGHSDIFRYINEGLKLGIFLDDAGWPYDSALVLSHVYQVITTKWACPNQNQNLITTIECLTKWLLAVLSTYNFDEAKEVLKKMMNALSELEKLEDRTLCKLYAFLAISQYHYVLMEYNKSWSWAMRAVCELRGTSLGVLKLLVVSHTIRVATILNKLEIGKKLIDQLHTYGEAIDENVHVHMLLTEACYSFKARARLANEIINNYYAALDSRRNLFGYFNLQTASVFVDYACLRICYNHLNPYINKAMSSMLQSIYIMRRIGLPEDSMVLIRAIRIKALILEEKALYLENTNYFVAGGTEQMVLNLIKKKKAMLHEAQILQENGLSMIIKTVGEESLITAKFYCDLGKLYQTEGKYERSEKMYLKAIEIKKKILDKDDPEVAISFSVLARLYAFYLKRYKEAEKLYLRSKPIYEVTYGKHCSELLRDCEGLIFVYKELKNNKKFNEHLRKIEVAYENRKAWLSQVHTAHDANCTKGNLSVDKLKCILDKCSCEK